MKIRNFFVKFAESYKNRHISLWMVFFVLVYCIGIIKLIALKEMDSGVLFTFYSIGVAGYILSRFAIAYFYVPDLSRFDPNYVPTVSFGVPSKNEEENIRRTILRIAASDYPKDKFDVIAINDGSDDNTLAEMLEAQKIAKEMGVTVKVTDWKVNLGKRDGMAECARQSANDIIIYIDSDSFVEGDTAKELVKYFIDPRIAAVAGHGYVANSDKNMLTKMQDVRYFVAFKAYKAAESYFGSVTCCSGCCSAYRRSYVMEVLDKWLNQMFLGVRCTYGDDRSLTNALLKKGYLTLYAAEAKAYTIVPDTFHKFMKQQLRWKKSWVRESLYAGLFMWRRNPIMSISYYLGVILPLLSPLVVMRALIWHPFETGKVPLVYVLGLTLMAIVYGLYYYIYQQDKKWIYGVIFATFYTLILVWQLPYAIINIRDARWGTR